MKHQVAKILYNQADKFLQQVERQLLKVWAGREILTNLLDNVTHENNQIKILVFFIQLQTFEDLLKCKKLQPFEQVKVRTQFIFVITQKNYF